MKKPDPHSDLRECFHFDAVRSTRAPRVLMATRLRGAARRVELRMPEAFHARMLKDAPGCRTTAVVALAQRGLLHLIDHHQRLNSQWIAERGGGRFVHVVLPAIDGQPDVTCSSFDADVPHSAVSIPGPLIDALKVHARHPGTALVALADWQLGLLLQRHERLIVTPGAGVSMPEKRPTKRASVRPSKR